MSLEKAAEGIVNIVNENMCGALRLVSVEQGYDPRDFALIAFGGAGPLHANALAQADQLAGRSSSRRARACCAPMAMRRRACATRPRARSSSASMRLSDAQVAHDARRPRAGRGARRSPPRASRPREQETIYQIDMRYAGQGMKLTVDATPADFRAEGLAGVARRFDRMHEQLFTFALDAGHELVGLRAVVLGRRSLSSAADCGAAAPIRRPAATQQEPRLCRRRLARGDDLRPRQARSRQPDRRPGHRHRDGRDHADPARSPPALVDDFGNILIRPNAGKARARTRRARRIEARTFEGAGNASHRSSRPRPRRSSASPVDPITLDIVENALRNARVEMDAVLFRTAMSPGIREQHDAFPLIANQEGKMVVGQFGSFLHGFIAGYDGTIEDGDVFLTNDPYSCAGAISHLNDWLLMMPIFLDGRLVSWAAMFGHMTDVGGKVPGSLPTDAKMIYEEGIIIPPVKIYRDGELNAGDAEASCSATAACRTGTGPTSSPSSRRCGSPSGACARTSRRFGVDTYISAMWEMLERNRRAMSAIIQMIIPEGSHRATFEDWIDDDGMGNGPYKIACTLWREGEKAIFDFNGCDPQSLSSINFLLNEEMFKMFFGAFTINLFDPQILFNDGFYDLLEVRIPAGCILKPKKPAALSCRTHMLGRIFDLMGGLLGQGAPEALNAAGFSDSPHFMYSGFNGKGEWYQLFQIGFGGIPGRPAGDGPDGHSLWPAFTNVPNEFLEAYFPLRILEYSRRLPDSGGAGLHRGGNGITIAYELLEPGEISIHDDRWFTYPWGVNGGTPGMRSTKRLVRKNGTAREHSVEVRPHPCRAGRRAALQHLGRRRMGRSAEARAGEGRGRRRPRSRHRERRSAATAWSLGRDGRLDTCGDREAAAGHGRASAAPTALFDRGFKSIAELRARCKAETGFDPPREPRFMTTYKTAAE